MMESSLPVDDLELENPPRKKVKILGQDDISTEATVNSVTAVENSNNISITPSLDITNDSIAGNMDGKPKIQTLIAIAENEQMQKELAVGIEVFVSDDPGFQGIMKRRYHDFQVNEIMPNGKVVRLDDPEMLKVKPKPIQKLVDIEPVTAIPAEKRSTVISNDQAVATGLPTAQSDSPINQSEVKALGLSANSASIDPELQSIRDIASFEDKDAGLSHSIDLSQQDFEQLNKQFGIDQVRKLATMFNEISSSTYKKPTAYGFVDSLSLGDKLNRKSAHQTIRKVFRGKVESAYEEGGLIRCTAAMNAISRKGKPNVTQVMPNNRSVDWEELGGDYMHFTLYKENRDGGDVLGHLASKLNIRGQKIFDVAGVKDRRATTVQRVSAYRLMDERFLHLNNIMNQSLVGDCSYSKDRLQLGDLAGNEFTITLRDCAVRISDSVYTTLVQEEIYLYITKSMDHLRQRGFINYYGLQRFGSFATGTNIVGKYIINGDYQAAVEKILEFSPSALKAAEDLDNTENVSQDDKRRAQAINWFNNKSTNIKKILSTLPRRFLAEHAIVSYLGKDDSVSKQYYRGALEAIPRGLRTLYPHAYQSFIWNHAASYRWRLGPGILLVGDLVLASRAPGRDTSFHVTKYDAQGDPIFEPSIHDRASIHEQYEGDSVYILTAEDIQSDHYSIFDVVLPQPGYNVKYPSTMLNFYTSVMRENGNINPCRMRRGWRDASLPGAYRKLLGRPFERYTFETVWYGDEEAQIVLTDIERMNMRKAQAVVTTPIEKRSVDLSRTAVTTSGINFAANIPRGPRLAVVLKFQLPSSTYATMALRELMKPGPVEYKPEFSSGRVM